MKCVLSGFSQIAATFTIREQTAYASAGAVAEEVLSSIRTVVAFGGEEKEADRCMILLIFTLHAITHYVHICWHPLPIDHYSDFAKTF